MDIQAAALVGSHARGAARPDSDVDLVILTADPELYLAEAGWAREFGALLRSQVEDYGRLTSVRCWYADGMEVEFGFSTPDWAGLPLDPGTRRVIEDGMQMLFERRPLLSPLARPRPPLRP